MSTTATAMVDDQTLITQLHLIRNQLNKKHSFETALASLSSLIHSSYVPSSSSTKILFHDVLSRLATVCLTRYTAPGFLLPASDLLLSASLLSSDPAFSSSLSSSAASLRSSVNLDVETPPHRNNRYLFEGHLTVDNEPPQPNWLVQQNLLTQSNTDDVDSMGSLLRGLVDSLEVSMEGLEDLLPADIAARRAAPPASKAAVDKLPVVKVDEPLAERLGDDAECCICKEKLAVFGVEMQEMPCAHLFHPPCLKPWLDEHNSCPVCRHELPTDDHKYESWKEREAELEEERRGAANAVRGGEFMYI
ncbi:hypothetical protein vseg_007899 [Gypsophila vaccaria]